MMNNRTTMVLPLLAATLLTGVTSCRQVAAEEGKAAYKTLTLEVTDRTLWTSFPATIEGRQDVAIYPQVSGLITQVCIAEGALVRKGQTLFIIDQVPYKAALETALANVQNAEAALATAQMTAESKRELYREHIVSDFDVRTAENTLRQQQAALALAQAELTNARNNLSYTEVKSPVNGTAGMINYRVGALVGSGMDEPLVRVSDNDEMYVYFSLSEKQMLELSRDIQARGDTAHAMPEVALELVDGSLYEDKGRIDAISGIVDTKTGAVSVRAVFPNKGHLLRSGGTAVLMLPHQRQGCIVIPQEATYELQDKVFVYKVVEGKTRSAEISVYAVSNGKEYVVESGLEAGEVIVAEGAGLLREGVEVSL